MQYYSRKQTNVHFLKYYKLNNRKAQNNLLLRYIWLYLSALLRNLMIMHLCVRNFPFGWSHYIAVKCSHAIGRLKIYSLLL